MFIYFINGKSATPPASNKVPELEKEVCDVWNSLVDGVSKYWKVLFLSRWALSVISYFVRFEPDSETETLVILDLAQTILIIIDVGLCYVYLCHRDFG